MSASTFPSNIGGEGLYVRSVYSNFVTDAKALGFEIFVELKLLFSFNVYKSQQEPICDQINPLIPAGYRTVNIGQFRENYFIKIRDREITQRIKI